MADNNFIIGTPDDVQKEDYQRFYKKDATGFSAERNKAIVEQTIKEYEAMRAKKAVVFDEHYAERSDAVVTYLKQIDRGNGSNGNLEKYFGRKWLAYLRGQEIRDKLMAGMTVRNKDGVILKPGGM